MSEFPEGDQSLHLIKESFSCLPTTLEFLLHLLLILTMKLQYTDTVGSRILKILAVDVKIKTVISEFGRMIQTKL